MNFFSKNFVNFVNLSKKLINKSDYNFSLVRESNQIFIKSKTYKYKKK